MLTWQPEFQSDFNKSQNGLPWKQRTQNHEYRRLGLSESLYIQYCSFRGCIRPIAPAEAVFDFQNNQIFSFYRGPQGRLDIISNCVTLNVPTLYK